MDSKKPLYFCIFMLFLLSMNLWIGWNGKDTYFYIIILLALMCMQLRGMFRLHYSHRSAISLLCFYIAMVYLYKSPLGGLTLLKTVLWGYILFIKDLDKIRCLRYITKWFAYLMVPSLVVYWLVQVGHIPSLGTTILQKEELLDRNPDYCIRLNYIFYLYTPTFYGVRFNGPFLEPGHLGMMLAFLLFCNRFRFSNKYNVILLVALLHTFSLAGYVLAFIAFMMIRYYEGKLRLIRLVLYSLLFLSVVLFANFYNGGDNFLNELIFDRLQLDEERGFSGNNRSSLDLAIYVDAMWRNPRLLLFGYSEYELEVIEESNWGRGFSMQMVRYGLFGILLILLFYISYFLLSKNKKFALLALIFVVVMYWQRAYWMWFSWEICYAYGIVYAERRKHKKRIVKVKRKKIEPQEEHENRDSYVPSCA